MSYFKNIATKSSFKKNRFALKQALKSIGEARETAKDKGLLDLDNILNVSQYMTICNYDLSIIVKNIPLSHNDWEKKLHARLLALIIFEFLDDLGGLLGKNFRDNIENLSNSAYLKQLGLVAKEFYKYKKKNQKMLKDIRVQAIGHREQDAKKQLEIIEKINTDNIFNLGIELINLLTKFAEFSANFYKECSNNFR